MLSVVIVAYRTPAALAAAITSLRAQQRPPREIVVVDNGAAEESPIPDRPEFEGVRFIRPESNLGFGAGCNRGLAATSGEQVLLLNADVVLTSGATARLADCMAADPAVAVVGPRVFSRGRLQHSARGFPSLRTGLLGRRSVLTRLLTRANRPPGELLPAYGESGPVDWVSGACMLVRRTAFDAVGGFDDGFWMYWEDADLCRRLVARGWKVWLEPAAVIDHATGASGTSEATVRAFHESAALFCDRYVVRRPVQQRVVRLILNARAWLILQAMARARQLP